MENICQFIESLGGLHDAEVASLTWMPAQTEVRMAVKDIYANFLDLPEYEGPASAVFVFSGVSDVEWVVGHGDDKLIISNWSITPTVNGYKSEVRVSPSGKLVIQCAALAHEVS